MNNLEFKPRGANLWLVHYADKIEVILKKICQSSTKHNNQELFTLFEDLEKNLNAALDLRVCWETKQAYKIDMQPLYRALTFNSGSKSARKAILRIIKHNKTIPELLEIFGKSQFLSDHNIQRGGKLWQKINFIH